jgi:hypothetical protein
MLPRRFVLCALLLAPSLPVPVHSPHDVVRFGRNIVLAPEQSFHNASCFLCSVSIEGRGTGGVRVFAGNVFLDGSVAGNVLVFGGNVTLTSKAAVEGRVVIFGGRLNRDSAATSHAQTVLPPIVFLPLILLICAVTGVLVVVARRMVRGPIAYPPLPRL